MGGFGSGSHWMHRRKYTADQCVDLDVNWLTREGLFDGMNVRAGTLSWSSSNLARQTFAAEYEVSTLFRWIRLKYTPGEDSDQVDQYVPLTTSPLPWGGRRWWFTCPMTSNGKKCDRRVGKLYLPRGGRYFACRHCYDLTYQSCRDSHRFDKLFRMDAEEIAIAGINPSEELAFWKMNKEFCRRWNRNEQRRRRRKALNWS